MRTVAIIGCGKGWVSGKQGFGIAHAHAEGWRQADPNVRLVAVDISPENLIAFGEKYQLPKENLFTSTKELYAAARPDFVSICTWPSLHAPMVIEAAKHGVKGIACEKPMALDAGEIRQMLASCDKHGTRMAIAHQRRYNPYLELARQFLADGIIGHELVLEARVDNDWDILSWTTHWFDMANYLLDATPEWILAGIDHTGERRYQHAVEHASLIMAQYPGRRQALFITGPDNPHSFPISIRGTGGLMRLYERQAIQVLSETGYREIIPPDFEQRSKISEFQHLMGELIEAVETGAPLRCDAKVCAVATEMAFAAHESARTMRKAPLPLETLFAPLEVVQHDIQPAIFGTRVLLYADGHFGSGGREGITEALLALTGREPMIIDAETQGLGEVDLNDINAISLYHTQKEADEGTQRVLTEWVESSNPLLVLHAALGAYPDWQAYQSWIGRIWAWGKSSHPYEAMGLVVTEGDPLGFGWASAWLPTDEVFIDLQVTSKTIDGMVADISTGQYPVAWINEDRPNIGCWMPGHRRDSWKVPAMRQGVGLLLGRLMKQPPKEKRG